MQNQQLVVINSDGQIKEIIEENYITGELQSMVDDYTRLLNLEVQYKESMLITKSNDYRIHVLLQTLVDKKLIGKSGAFSGYAFIKPYFDEMINEYEIRKRLDKRLQHYLDEKRKVFWENVKVLWWKGLAWFGKNVGSLFKKNTKHTTNNT